jgi:hypothetical protein
MVVVSIKQPAQVVLGGSVSLPLIMVTIVILKRLTVGLKHRDPPSLLLKKLKKLFAVFAFFSCFTSVNPTSTYTHTRTHRQTEGERERAYLQS